MVGSLISRMDAVQSPVIPIVGDLIRRHPGTISLGQGVVYYGPPPQALAQLSQAFQDPNNHKYQSVQGILPLRQAIQTKLQQENGIGADLEQIVVTAGSNMGFVNAVLAITQPGDEIILLSPYYFNHEMAITIAGCHPVIVPTDANYQIQIDKIQQAITAKTRAIVTISPNNPSGAVYAKASLQQVNELCRKEKIYHISDEAYEYFTYDGIQHFSPASLPQSAAHTLSLFSLSKAYGFASWRIGYMVIPPHLQLAIQKIQDTILICPPVVSQYAAVGALQAGVGYCREKLAALLPVRQLLLNAFSSLPRCQFSAAMGAFYVLLQVQTDLSPMEMVERLIRQYGVAVIPGDAFGLHTGCSLRVAYGALPQSESMEGVGRLVQGLEAILR